MSQGITYRRGMMDPSVVEHAKNIHLQVKMILIGFRPWGRVAPPPPPPSLSIRLVQSAKRTLASQIETVIGWQRLIEMLGNK